MNYRCAYPSDFHEVIECLRLQACESVSQFQSDVDCSRINSAKDLWNNLKPRITYCKDPKGVELFQTYETLFYNNFHGKSGHGDCDCFVISTLAGAAACGLPCKVVLAGRDKKTPVHIWCEVDGYAFDLTNPTFNTFRPYPFIQKFSLYVNEL